MCILARHKRLTQSSLTQPLSVYRGADGIVYNITTTLDIDTILRQAAATVYNMALANHFQALHEPAGSVRRDCLDRALKSYTAARDVLEAVADNDDLADATEDVKFLLLAIANNEGHVCEQLSFLDRARDCLGQLHVILPCTSRSEEFGQFLVTAILFPKPERLSLHAPVA